MSILVPPITDLPPLRDVIAEFDLGAKKSLGQHFLLDLNITRKIARLSQACAGETIIEVGPGPGGLTRALLETGADIIAIERDTRCIEALIMQGRAWPDMLTLIEADALKANEAELLLSHPKGLERPCRLVSNLPYNISTELLIKWLKTTPPWWTSLTLMFQKEVGDRILAAPGSKTYGRLSVVSQAITHVQRGFNLPASAFTPPPKIDSSVLHFEPKKSLDFDISKLEKLTAAAFSQRRKMLRSSLKSIWAEQTEKLLEDANIKPTLRAEDVSVDDYIHLSSQVS